jgi:peptidoglycan/xylan/chitin deacetylase (PgdA/CDA1 family)
MHNLPLPPLDPERAAPLVRASVALHVGAAGVALLRPHLWPWALAAVVADHLLLTAAGLWPRSHLLGPNWTRLPGDRPDTRIAITIDDGPDPEVTGSVLELLEQHAARATFFCVGERVVRYPQLAGEITRRGHEIGNHSYRHLKRFSLLGPRGLADEVARAQQAISAASGAVPRFFRAPAGLRNPFLEPVLARANLRLVSWTRRGFDTVNTSPTPVLARLTRKLGGGDILLLHDGHAARTRAGVPLILAVLPALLTAIKEAGLVPVTLSSALPPGQPAALSAARPP